MAMGPSFFTFINSSQLQKLQIPLAFMKKHGKVFSDSVSLNILISTGAKWEVELTLSENGDKAWLEKGWPQFVEFYSIKIGYFLVFTYSASCGCFHVCIMSPSACEIEYPVDTKTKPGTSTPSLKRKREGTTYSKLPAQVAAGPKKVYGLRCYLTSDEKKRAEEYPTNGPSFVVKVKPSYMPNSKMSIPIEFAKEHLKEEEMITVINLVNVTGKTWSVNYEEAKHKHGTYETLLTKGWKVFAKDNELSVGDICIFELIESGKNKMFKVVVLPAITKINPTKNCPIINLEADND